jgi:hypothetical protein
MIEGRKSKMGEVPVGLVLGCAESWGAGGVGRRIGWGRETP